MLSDICETFRTANIYFQIKKNACFYIFGLVVTLVILLASKRENSSQIYNYYIYTSRFFRK